METSQGRAVERVAIVAMGPSARSFFDAGVRGAGVSEFADAVWAINKAMWVVRHDVGFRMDSPAVFERRIEESENDKQRRARSQMRDFLRTHNRPVYSGIRERDPRYPCLVPYPLAEVVGTLRSDYFNGGVSYAVAMAIVMGVKRISLFGCDYTNHTNPHAHGERGRGCVEFYLGMANAHGIEVIVPSTSCLIDGNVEPQDRFYGYDPKPQFTMSDGAPKLEKT